jgi:SAM-dependent methyltransferase
MPESRRQSLGSHFVGFFFFFPGERDLAIDIGCGSGQATLPLAQYFKKVIGVEPSAGQLESVQVSARMYFRPSQFLQSLPVLVAYVCDEQQTWSSVKRQQKRYPSPTPPLT